MLASTASSLLSVCRYDMRSPVRAWGISATAHETVAGWDPRGRPWDEALTSVSSSGLRLLWVEKAFGCSTVGGPQESSGGLEDQQWGDAAWPQAQGHAADQSGDDPAKDPNNAALCPRGCDHPRAAEFGTVPSLFTTSCRGAFIMPLTPTARKAGRMVSGTSSL